MAKVIALYLNRANNLPFQNSPSIQKSEIPLSPNEKFKNLVAESFPRRKRQKITYRIFKISSLVCKGNGYRPVPPKGKSSS